MKEITHGFPYPLGSYFDGKGTNFAICSANCYQIELCLFDEHGQEQRLELTNHNGDIWYGYVPDCQPGQHYGYRVHGPYTPEQGHFFNPKKLLIDPYSKLLSGPLQYNAALTVGDDQPDSQDSASFIMKSIVVADENYDWQGDQHPNTPMERSVIYEAHVKGLTKRHPDIPEDIRGSYAALGHPAVVNYLKQLGITAIELLPIYMFADEEHLSEHNLTNYWGYNTLAPFALEPRYGSGRENITAATEFRDSVKALHSNGIEVILDVVFNHTAEGGAGGPTLCLRGLDNACYYWNTENGEPMNWSGCGNTVNANHPMTLRWILDCLRYWITEFHVDGFRFDLGSILGRNPGFTDFAPIFIAMSQDPIISQTKLIAEPWDIGDFGYQLGAFPAPFSEWNAEFRDNMRRFWLHKDISLGALAGNFSASGHIFHHTGRNPQASVNFLTAHDGFTLQDLVSFNEKHNEANGEDNQDGNNSNFSFNHGFEGLDAPDDIKENRYASKKALLTTLLLSFGVPMMLSGDECGHSQQGNNNTYCQDNELTWMDWQNQDKDLIEFCRTLIKIRQLIPALTQTAWWTNEVTEDGTTDVQWLSQSGENVPQKDWNNTLIKVMQILLSENWLLLINASDDEQTYQLPEGNWYQHVTNRAHEHDSNASEHTAPAQSVTILSHSPTLES